MKYRRKDSLECSITREVLGANSVVLEFTWAIWVQMVLGASKVTYYT